MAYSQRQLFQQVDRILNDDPHITRIQANKKAHAILQAKHGRNRPGDQGAKINQADLKRVLVNGSGNYSQLMYLRSICKKWADMIGHKKGWRRMIHGENAPHDYLSQLRKRRRQSGLKRQERTT